MIHKGNWIGHYTFDNPAYNRIRGFEETIFDIEIIYVDQNNFTSKVQDDLSTGGTEGIGEIVGKVIGDKVAFVKQMPVLTLLTGKNQARKSFNKNHRKIYYSGRFSEDKKSISGQWRFKFGFIFIGLIPIPVIPSKGTWTMTLID
jgi:hypothetical protein